MVPQTIPAASDIIPTYETATRAIRRAVLFSDTLEMIFDHTYNLMPPHLRAMYCATVRNIVENIPHPPTIYRAIRDFGKDPRVTTQEMPEHIPLVFMEVAGDIAVRVRDADALTAFLDGFKKIPDSFAWHYLETIGEYIPFKGDPIGVKRLVSVLSQPEIQQLIERRDVKGRAENLLEYVSAFQGSPDQMQRIVAAYAHPEVERKLSEMSPENESKWHAFIVENARHSPDALGFSSQEEVNHILATATYEELGEKLHVLTYAERQERLVGVSGVANVLNSPWRNQRRGFENYFLNSLHRMPADKRKAYVNLISTNVATGHLSGRFGVDRLHKITEKFLAGLTDDQQT